MIDDHVFITRIDEGRTGDGAALRLAVKDCIDVAGVATTAGSAVIAKTARPAEADAECLSGFREAGVQIVGKTNLHELCFGATGVNPHFGTPVNPLDPARIPGGSSSGSAVALATRQADVALGTDTAGSIRNPAAFCGIAGLKTTFGRIPVGGTRPLAPSMDTIGPMARDVDGVATGMAMLEPGFEPDRSGLDGPLRVGRLRGVEADVRIERAVDDALASAFSMQGVEVVDIVLEGWDEAVVAGRDLMFAEALVVNTALVEESLTRLSLDVIERLLAAREIDDVRLEAVRVAQVRWRDTVERALDGVDVLAVHSHPRFPDRIGEHDTTSNPAGTAVSFAGNPAIVVPVPTLDGPPTTTGSPFPASVQIIGPWNHEERLIAIGSYLEQQLPV